MNILSELKSCWHLLREPILSYFNTFLLAVFEWFTVTSSVWDHIEYLRFKIKFPLHLYITYLYTQIPSTVLSILYVVYILFKYMLYVVIYYLLILFVLFYYLYLVCHWHSVVLWSLWEIPRMCMYTYLSAKLSLILILILIQSRNKWYATKAKSKTNKYHEILKHTPLFKGLVIFFHFYAHKSACVSAQETFLIIVNVENNLIFLWKRWYIILSGYQE